MTTVRIVDELRPTVGATLCLKWLQTEHPLPRLCCLPKGHAGTCLKQPRFPKPDITTDNPAYDRSAA